MRAQPQRNRASVAAGSAASIVLLDYGSGAAPARHGIIQLDDAPACGLAEQSGYSNKERDDEADSNH